ncbi:hypothetical protein HYH03_001055 [Edaphochlamys debaryana]|uniref:Uncharacterized protein n=1 Tax=Edaphochlamys debaryana TaxID=47281 RepID=A0A835YHE3_9CHLO|nr:hypothetical protein HYH03_001055 [Edaphochlamys debaryana]|eukprot:KAG2501248.1 hypothetical protein HYH03_001055 [Edaphochlamys debaryana]
MKPPAQAAGALSFAAHVAATSLHQDLAAAAVIAVLQLLFLVGALASREAAALPSFPAEGGRAEQALHLLRHAPWYLFVRPATARDWALLVLSANLHAVAALLAALAVAGRGSALWRWWSGGARDWIMLAHLPLGRTLLQAASYALLPKSRWAESCYMPYTLSMLTRPMTNTLFLALYCWFVTMRFPLAVTASAVNLLVLFGLAYAVGPVLLPDDGAAASAQLLSRLPLMRQVLVGLFAAACPALAAWVAEGQLRGGYRRTLRGNQSALENGALPLPAAARLAPGRRTACSAAAADSDSAADAAPAVTTSGDADSPPVRSSTLHPRIQQHTSAPQPPPPRQAAARVLTSTLVATPVPSRVSPARARSRPTLPRYYGLTRVATVTVKVRQHPGSFEQYGTRLAASAAVTILRPAVAVTSGCVVVEGCAQLIAWRHALRRTGEDDEGGGGDGVWSLGGLLPLLPQLLPDAELVGGVSVQAQAGAEREGGAEGGVEVHRWSPSGAPAAPRSAPVRLLHLQPPALALPPPGSEAVEACSELRVTVASPRAQRCRLLLLGSGGVVLAEYGTELAAGEQELRTSPSAIPSHPTLRDLVSGFRPPALESVFWAWRIAQLTRSAPHTAFLIGCPLVLARLRCAPRDPWDVTARVASLSFLLWAADSAGCLALMLCSRLRRRQALVLPSSSDATVRTNGCSTAIDAAPRAILTGTDPTAALAVRCYKLASALLGPLLLLATSSVLHWGPIPSAPYIGSIKAVIGATLVRGALIPSAQQAGLGAMAAATPLLAAADAFQLAAVQPSWGAARVAAVVAGWRLAAAAVAAAWEWRARRRFLRLAAAGAVPGLPSGSKAKPKLALAAHKAAARFAYDLVAAVGILVLQLLCMGALATRGQAGAAALDSFPAGGSPVAQALHVLCNAPWYLFVRPALDGDWACLATAVDMYAVAALLLTLAATGRRGPLWSWWAAGARDWVMLAHAPLARTLLHAASYLVMPRHRWAEAAFVPYTLSMVTKPVANAIAIGIYCWFIPVRFSLAVVLSAANLLVLFGLAYTVGPVLLPDDGSPASAQLLSRLPLGRQALVAISAAVWPVFVAWTAEKRLWASHAKAAASQRQARRSELKQSPATTPFQQHEPLPPEPKSAGDADDFAPAGPSSGVADTIVGHNSLTSSASTATTLAAAASTLASSLGSSSGSAVSDTTLATAARVASSLRRRIGGVPVAPPPKAPSPVNVPKDFLITAEVDDGGQVTPTTPPPTPPSPPPVLAAGADAWQLPSRIAPGAVPLQPAPALPEDPAPARAGVTSSYATPSTPLLTGTLITRPLVVQGVASGRMAVDGARRTVPLTPYQGLTRMSTVSLKVRQHPGSFEQYGTRLAASVSSALLCPGSGSTSGCVVVEGCAQLIAWRHSLRLPGEDGGGGGGDGVWSLGGLLPLLPQLLPDAELVGGVSVQAQAGAEREGIPVQAWSPAAASASPRSAAGASAPARVRLLHLQPPVLALPPPGAEAAEACGELRVTVASPRAQRCRLLLLGRGGVVLAEYGTELAAGEQELRVGVADVLRAAEAVGATASGGQAPLALRLALVPPAHSDEGGPGSSDGPLLHFSAPLLLLPAAPAAELAGLWSSAASAPCGEAAAWCEVVCPLLQDLAFLADGAVGLEVGEAAVGGSVAAAVAAHVASFLEGNGLAATAALSRAAATPSAAGSSFPRKDETPVADVSAAATQATSSSSGSPFSGHGSHTFAAEPRDGCGEHRPHSPCTASGFPSCLPSMLSCSAASAPAPAPANLNIRDLLRGFRPSALESAFWSWRVGRLTRLAPFLAALHAQGFVLGLMRCAAEQPWDVTVRTAILSLGSWAGDVAGCLVLLTWRRRSEPAVRAPAAASAAGGSSSGASGSGDGSSDGDHAGGARRSSVSVPARTEVQAGTVWMYKLAFAVFGPLLYTTVMLVAEWAPIPSKAYVGSLRAGFGATLIRALLLPSVQQAGLGPLAVATPLLAVGEVRAVQAFQPSWSIPRVAAVVAVWRLVAAAVTAAWEWRARWHFLSLLAAGVVRLEAGGGGSPEPLPKTKLA